MKQALGARTRLEVGVGGGHEHAALSGSVVVLGATAQKDVALVSPGGTPRVLDLVVVVTALSSVADGEDTVVEVSSAGASEDTRGVELEVLLVSLDGNRHGLLGEGIHHSAVRVGLDISVAAGGRGSHLVAGRVAAGASSPCSAGSIRVVSLGTQATVLASPGEGIVHEATVAAHVSALGVALAIVAIHQGFQGAQIER